MVAKKSKKKHATKRRSPARAAVRKPAPKKPTKRAAMTVPALTPPRLGTIWRGQGGVYIGDIRGEKGQPDYRLVAHVGAELEGSYGPTAKVAGAVSRYDGLANTRAMAEAGSAIAKAALALKHEGHADYYIGATNEARIADVNGREHFPKDTYLWTSTQYELDDDWAWLQSFGGWQSVHDPKSYEYRAFVLRRVPIQ